MIGDLFTKPFQGTLFTQMQAKILNLPGSTSPTMHRSALKNRKYESKKSEQKIADGEIGVDMEEGKQPQLEGQKEDHKK